MRGNRARGRAPWLAFYRWHTYPPRPGLPSDGWLRHLATQPGRAWGGAGGDRFSRLFGMSEVYRQRRDALAR